ncbi:unnamed protein product, partial [Larinioides sclopetarius]
MKVLQWTNERYEGWITIPSSLKEKDFRIQKMLIVKCWQEKKEHLIVICLEKWSLFRENGANYGSSFLTLNYWLRCGTRLA